MPNQISLIHIDVPMTEPFRISSGEIHSKESILIHIEKDGIGAWGEASPMSGSFYSTDTPDSVWEYLKDHALPELIKQNELHPSFVTKRLDEGAGERFAWAGLEGALWDLRVQEEGISFPESLGAEFHPIESGLAVGIYPSFDELIAACDRYMQDGYKRLKIKIEPGWDIEPLREIRRAFGDIPLMVDANASYDEKFFPIFDDMEAYDLLMIEQPLAKENFEGHRALQKRIKTPVCIDESAENMETVRRAIEMDACRIVNLKIQRTGGLTKTKEIYDLCEQHEIPVWIGTMPELGIGALHALYLGLLPHCQYPTDVEASRRWFEEDIIDPPIEVKDGFITIPTEHQKRPNVNERIVERYTQRIITLPF